MIDLESINKKSWKKILSLNSPDDVETIKFLHEHEEEILNSLIENSEEKTLEEKRIEYIRNLLSDNTYKTDVEEVIKKIDDIREENGYSILQLGKRLPGSSYIVFEFGDKVIKFGDYYEVLKNPNILQPEFQLPFGNNNQCMTVYERIPEIFPRNDFEIAQEMYNRIRNSGIVWFDAIGNNVGRTNKRRDENDDGLRIIDAQYMEYERDVLLRINPPEDERYKYGGPGMYKRAIKDYIVEKGYGFREKTYEEMKEEKRKQITKQDVETVAKKSSIPVLQRVKAFFNTRSHRKENIEIDEK